MSIFVLRLNISIRNHTIIYIYNKGYIPHILGTKVFLHSIGPPGLTPSAYSEKPIFEPFSDTSLVQKGGGSDYLFPPK